jgi:hypothetical protein
MCGGCELKGGGTWHSKQGDWGWVSRCAPKGESRDVEGGGVWLACGELATRDPGKWSTHPSGRKGDDGG